MDRALRHDSILQVVLAEEANGRNFVGLSKLHAICSFKKGERQPCSAAMVRLKSIIGHGEARVHYDRSTSKAHQAPCFL